jgi:hypothetical protein
MKSRSSTGVGMKVDLTYNVETMRITDEGAENDGHQPHTSSIMSQIKARTNVDNSTGEIMDANPGVKIEVGNNKLKNMLADIKAQSR